MQQYWIAVYIMTAIINFSSYAQDLSIIVNPTKTTFSATEDVQVTVKYSNVGSNNLVLYKWLLPETTLNDPLFVITCNDNPIQYVGPLMRRRQPTSNDIFSLTPGMNVNAIIQISSAYNMTQDCNYNIQFHMHAARVFPTWKASLESDTYPSDSVDQHIVTSNMAVFFAAGRPNSLIASISTGKKMERLAPVFFPTCLDSQQTAITASVTAAKRLAVLTQFYLKKRDPSATPRFTTWFGRFSNEAWDTLVKNYNNVQDTFANQNLTFDCNCTGRPNGVVAFVYSSLPYTIYLCPTFFTMSTTGSDSASGSLIHEVTHFTVVAGTLDNAYGVSTCQDLARTNPAAALTNADTYQYFAENEPPAT